MKTVSGKKLSRPRLATRTAGHSCESVGAATTSTARPASIVRLSVPIHGDRAAQGRAATSLTEDGRAFRSRPGGRCWRLQWRDTNKAHRHRPHGSYRQRQEPRAERASIAGRRGIDADRVAHEVAAPGGPVFAGIVAEFGAGILGPDGCIDPRARRAGLRRRSRPGPAGGYRASGRGGRYRGARGCVRRAGSGRRGDQADRVRVEPASL